MALQERNQKRLLSCTPLNWVPMSSEFNLVNLTEGTSEFEKVTRKIKSTLEVEVHSVVRVQNPYLWGCYQLKKLEYETKGCRVTEIDLFHCTAASNINSIAADNLDWRRCKRSKYGQGVSFSPSAEYANQYANLKIGSDRALILATVLVGREVYGNKNMIIPPKSYDTSCGNRNRNGTLVYVKYDDYEFYPLHVAYYTSHVTPGRRPMKRIDEPFNTHTPVQNNTSRSDQNFNSVPRNDNLNVRTSVSRPIQTYSPLQNAYTRDNSFNSIPYTNYPYTNYHDSRTLNSVSRPVQRSYNYQYESKSNNDWSCVLL